MLSQFQNEVLSYGPTAVLPQNLNDKWIKRLQKRADDFLDSNFDLQECKDPRNIADSLLTACVYEIVYYQQGANASISPAEMAQKMAVYALSLTMESVHRETNIGLQAPNLDNILSMDRIIAYQEAHPEFFNILKQACIVRIAGKGWFRTMKDKFLSGSR